MHFISIPTSFIERMLILIRLMCYFSKQKNWSDWMDRSKCRHSCGDCYHSYGVLFFLSCTPFFIQTEFDDGFLTTTTTTRKIYQYLGNFSIYTLIINQKENNPPPNNNPMGWGLFLKGACHNMFSLLLA